MVVLGPRVFFDQDRYKVEEFEDRRNYLVANINRTGDLTSELSVGVMSADITAKADQDYVRVDQGTWLVILPISSRCHCVFGDCEIGRLYTSPTRSNFIGHQGKIPDFILQL